VSSLHSYAYTLLLSILVTITFNTYLDSKWQGRHERIVKVVACGYVVVAYVVVRAKVEGLKVGEELTQAVGCF
jgi:hypothetical protein